MFSRLFVFFAVLLASALSFADEVRLGIYFQGTRIGDASYSMRDEMVAGRLLKRGDSRTNVNAGMLGTALQVLITSTSWSDASGKPVRMLFVTKSGGRSQTVNAVFKGDFADVDIVSGGPKQTKRLPIPKDGPIVDDPMPLVLTSGVNSRKTFYVLQPNTVSFVKDEAINRGPATVTIGTKSYSATLVEVIDPQATMKIYVSAKGDLIKAEAPLGMEIIPDSLGAPSVGAGGPMADIAAASSIKPDKPIADPRHLKRFKFELVAPGAPTIPSDGHQTAIKKGDSWNIDVHPVEIDSSNIAIQAAAKAQPLWVTADTYIPSDSAKFKALAKQIVGKETSVKGASLKVQKWVASHMKANLGIGVLRDANEILSSKEGVCRDSAILAATILRAARVPTKLASGLVSWDGTFYYHAWVEVWNGKSWVGIDPTVADRQLSASHVKLAGGNIATAFRFPVLDKVSIKVGEAVPR